MNDLLQKINARLPALKDELRTAIEGAGYARKR